MGFSSAFALYIERFAVFISHHLGPDIGYIEEGESTAGYTFVWDLFLALT
jgi:hypothetical protein